MVPSSNCYTRPSPRNGKQIKKQRQTNKKRDTEFRAQKTVTVFDLDNPNVFASLHGSLSECVYVKNPISAPRVKRTYLDAKSKKTKTYTSEWHGLTDDKSGSKPRGRIKLVGGAEGLLTYSNCELDRKGKDGGMACAAPGKKIPM